ncbi:hypothetical protein [Microtetraspora sp. NBRC 16547]|uniref:WXG100-like domain-containing protein n=1 Tax=Microtetraspora sp. NBRC 16547 TaxID=3030993 RepID=UPI0025537323|nr:hypothetical protein [Microtetraspora sp. NBRC 16547]
MGIAPTEDVELPTDWLSAALHSNINKIKNWVDDTEPNTVRRAGQYYCAAQTLLEDFAGHVKSAAVALAENYRGPVAVETQKQLRSLHASARELAAKLGQIGRTLQDYAETLVWAQRNVVVKRFEDSRSDHDMDWADAIPFYGIQRVEKRAVNHLREVNKLIVKHYAALPSEVQLALPDPNAIDLPVYTPTGFDPDKVTVTMPGGPNGTLPGFSGPGGMPSAPNPSMPKVDGMTGTGLNSRDLGLTGPGTDGVTPSVLGPSTGGSGGSGWNGGATGGGLPETGPGAGTGWGTGSGNGPGNGPGTADLAGYNGPGTLTPPGTSLTGPSSGGLPSSGGSTGSGAFGGGSTGIVPAYDGMSGGRSGGMSGGGATSPRTGARGAGAGAGAGRPGANGMVMPASHGGRGREEQADRENDTWLTEDDEVWGHGGTATPPIVT